MPTFLLKHVLDQSSANLRPAQVFFIPPHIEIMPLRLIPIRTGPNPLLGKMKIWLDIPSLFLNSISMSWVAKRRTKS